MKKRVLVVSSRKIGRFLVDYLKELGEVELVEIDPASFDSVGGDRYDLIVLECSLWKDMAERIMGVSKSTLVVVVDTEKATELERYRRDLRLSEERYRELWENANDLFYIIDLEGNLIDANRAARETFGYTEEEIRGLNIKQIVDEEYLPLVVEKIREKIESGRASEPYEVLCYTKDGRRVWLEIRSHPIFEEGKIVAIQGVARDITERKRIETALRESEEKFRKMFESLPNFVAIVNSNLVFVEANPAMKRSLSTDPIGRSLYDVLPPAIAQRRSEKIKEALRVGETVLDADERDGRYFVTRYIPITLSGEKHVMVVAEDMTEFVKTVNLLKVINRINDLMVKERDVSALLSRVCELLTSLRKSYSVHIALLGNDGITWSTSHGDVVCASPEDMPCVEEAIARKRKVIMRAENRIEHCPYHEKLPNLNCLALPMIYAGDVVGVVIINAAGELPSEDEVELLSTLANDLAFAVKAIEMEKERMNALRQIEDNIEKFAILVDHLRNPLAALSGYAEMFGDDELRKKIQEQIKKMEEVIEKLEKGWLESEKVREFLRKVWYEEGTDSGR